MSNKHEARVPGGVDPTICPLCGQPNDCANARGETGCWCEAADVPPEVVFRVPKEARGRACVCRACARLTGGPQG
jgi:hypothetical protein